jgi:hypothetical protein
MNPASLEPHNELERLLARAQAGELAGEDFLRELLLAQVFMPVYEKYQISGFQRSDQAQPLLLEGEDGSRLLALFTSPERAKPFLAEYPGYEGGLLAEFKWVLEKTGSGIGIILNPGYDLGMEMEPEMVQQLMRH